ncbi:transmembrane protein 132E-like [Acanthaster planci]|uniref:Transmembrane protein 132E-like n=1 Tax=Acanthaster planci TaxID=133434 RepID=A0A8B7YJ52_ACAPL|nr:transmembrane protein 132E-like [Acanthaster planci]
MAGRASWWFMVGIVVVTVHGGNVEAKFRRSDIQSEPWAEFPVHFAPLNSQSVLLSKMAWNSSSVFPSGPKPGQGGLYADQMVGVVGPHSGAVRATYGPFVVEGSLEKHDNDSQSLSYDIMAELATQEFVSPHSSRIQVLFLVRPKHQSMGEPRTLPCLRTRAWYGESEAGASCLPSAQSLSCLAQIAVPPAWWRDVESTGIQSLTVSYSVHSPSSCSRGTEDQPLFPEHSLGNVQFQQRQEVLTTIKEDKNVWLYVPKTDVAVGERFQISVSIHQNFTAPGCVIRAKARRGLRVINVHPTNQDAWVISYRVKQRGGSAMVTVQRGESTDTPPTAHSEALADVPAFTVEFEVENTTSSSRLANWRIDYEQEQHTTTIVTTVPVASTSGQSVIPVVWADDIVNTAVLDGERVSLPMSVVTVTQSGQVQNITASAQCTSLDPDVLKVKQDCSALYVDGTETGGAVGKKIRVSFAGQEVYKAFKVWYPELPLEVVLSDPKLSLIRGWKIPAATQNRSRRDAQQTLDLGAETLGLLGPGNLQPDTGRDNTAKGKCKLRYQQAKVDVYTRFYAPQANTVPRLTGLKQYLYGDDIRHHVTHHTRHQLQAVDQTIILVEGTRVTGLAEGMTQIQVIGQDGQQVLGEATIAVSDNKVEVSELHVGLVSGLALQSVPLAPENSGRDRSLTRVSSNRALFAEFQEAIMDARLEFDDGTEVALQDVDIKDFEAVITTLNPEMVTKSPGSTPHHPAVIAVREGSTTLMLEVALPPECQRRKRNGALAFDVIPVNVSFADRPKQWWPSSMDEDLLGNADGSHGRIRLTPEAASVDYGVVRSDYDPDKKRPKHGGGGGGGTKSEGGIISIPIDIPFPYDPVDEFDQADNANIDGSEEDTSDYPYTEESLSPLEIGMYIVLGIFCIAILAFMINCVLFMARYRRSKKVPDPLGGTYPQNWVLFGTEFDGRTMPVPHHNEESIPMRDFRDDSNHGDCGSRGEHTCTESEVSVERHSVEEDEQNRACLEEGVLEGKKMAASEGSIPHCHHASCADLDDPDCCITTDSHETAAFIACQCQCQCYTDSDPNVNNDSTAEERDDESQCTDTERTPLNPPNLPQDPSSTPLAGACCDLPGGDRDTHSDTLGDALTEALSDSELRITINLGEGTESVHSSLKSQEVEDLDQTLDYLDDHPSTC